MSLKEKVRYICRVGGRHWVLIMLSRQSKLSYIPVNIPFVGASCSSTFFLYTSAIHLRQKQNTMMLFGLKSEISDKGPSKIRTITLQRTLISTPC